MDCTVATIYRPEDDEETTRKRVRVLVDSDYDSQDILGGLGGVLRYAEWRDQDRFLSSLNYRGREYNEEVLSTGGILFDGSRYWTEGPSDQYGQFYVSWADRKSAKEYKDSAYKSLRILLDDGVVGFVYETRCDCCSQWEIREGLWGIVGWNEKMALDYMEEFTEVSA